MLRKINAPEDIHFPSRQSWYKPTTDIFTQYYFSHVPPKLLQEYLLKYALDFKMVFIPIALFSKKILLSFQQLFVFAVINLLKWNEIILCSKYCVTTLLKLRSNE